jgi:ribosomal protein L10
VLLGCRHGTPAGNKGLSGRIFRARLYDRALTPAEIEQTARIEASSVTEADLLATLTPEQRKLLAALQAQRERQSQRTTAVGDDPVLLAWTSFAQSLINLKEFIYLP